MTHDRGESLRRLLRLIRVLEMDPCAVTLDELARAFEVTTRTIRRDLAVLAQVGGIVNWRHEDAWPHRSVIHGLAWTTASTP